ncbi:MAG: tetratricopeptide repeat protein [Lentimicrobiaceae bacterium]|nr:tetratricopeptide repeat protein [Lentimicrobiaceae bacterium]
MANHKGIGACRRLLVFLLFVLGGLGYGFTQDVLETLKKASRLYEKANYAEAAILLNDIADDCMNAQDSIRLLFFYINGYVQFELGNYEKSIDYTLKEIELRQKYQMREEEYIFVFERLGNAFEKIGDNENAEKYYRRGLLKTITLLSDTNELQIVNGTSLREYRSLMYQKLGTLYSAMGDTTMAKMFYRQRTADLFGKKAQECLALFSDGLRKTISMREAGRYEESMAVFDEMAFWMRQIDTINEEYILVLKSKGIELQILKQFDEAALVYKKIIDISRKFPYAIENVVGSYWGNIICEASLGNFERAEKMISQAISYAKHIPGGIEMILNAIYYTGNMAYGGERYAEAISYYERYLSYEQEVGLNYAIAINSLSVCYLMQGFPSKAKTCLMNILQYEVLLFDMENKGVLAQIYHNLGRACMLLGEYIEAIDFLQQSIAIQKEKFGEPSVKTIEYLRECQEYIR